MGARAARAGVLAALLGVGAGLLLWPEGVMDSVRASLEQCAKLVIPSLFPFLVLSSLVISLGYGEGLGRRLGGVMKPLFGLNGSCAAALLLGLIGGYPVGARTAGQLYQQGQCSQTQAQRMLLFCNNCGPAFLLSTVGAAVFASPRAGWILWLSHVTAALGLGVLLRVLRPIPPDKGRADLPRQAVAPLPAALTAAVTDSAWAMLKLCAFIVIFAVVVRLLSLCGALSLCATVLARLPLGLDGTGCAALLAGILELTGGVCKLTGQSAAPGLLALSALLLGWGGCSVHCQTMAVLQGTGLSLKGYLPAKAMHGLLSAGIAYALALLFPEPETIITIAYVTAPSLPLLPLVAAAGWAGVALLLLLRKRGGKSPCNRI